MLDVFGPAGPARLVRRPGGADVRRVERAGVPAVVPGDAAGPGVVVAAGRPRGADRAADPLDGLDRRGLRLTDVDGQETEVAADVTVFALGGASWPRLGSDGGWVGPFADRGVAVAPLRPANVGMRVGWSDTFADRFEGTPLKHVALTVRGRPVRRCRATRWSPGRGSRADRSTRSAPRRVTPSTPTAGASSRSTCGPRSRSTSSPSGCSAAGRRTPRRTGSAGPSVWTRSASRCCASRAPVPCRPTRGTMAALVKAVPVVVVATMPIEKAISTAGGIAWSEVDDALMLRRLPGTFVAGEMLDWEAPTGRLPAAGVVQHRGRRGPGCAGVAGALRLSRTRRRCPSPGAS